ncbi:MAG: acyl-CoA dehydratase activase-related protein [Spirochaetia bacterium]
MTRSPRAVRAGIDVGSTTVKLAVLDADDRLLYGSYERHKADIRGTLIAVIEAAHDAMAARGQDLDVSAAVTGSGGLSVSQWLELPFIQEVIAGSRAVRRFLPDTDVAIELGGEDAKITYFAGGLEQRMNGTCAGGTGAFIDQMASLLSTDAAGLNDLARSHETIYPIAARCGVFAKTDVQPLINEGARREDIAASILQAVVNQTISGLACGKPIRGTVAFLGGPLHFLPETRRLFMATLGLKPSEVRVPEQAQLFVAMGAAIASRESAALPLRELRDRARSLCRAVTPDVGRLRALFLTSDELAAFRERHGRARAHRIELSCARGPCFLGIDAGSTTTKAVLVDAAGAIAWSAYEGNGGSPLSVAVRMVTELRRGMPAGAWIARSCSTGYGEALVKEALGLDEGEVETIAHYTAAARFLPGVDAILDIGGQDMKFLRLRDGAISSVLLNEACSSGCGSFLETFSRSLGLPIEEFSREALGAKAPVDLGSRCTVFMNSRVKQTQKEGATIGDISAGLSYSVIRNALQKVIRLRASGQLGERVIVQGGTFANDAVLRAFELMSRREAVRPDIAGLMGAFGAALIALDRAGEGAHGTPCGSETRGAHGTPCGSGARSTLLGLEELERLRTRTLLERCGRCANNCLVTITRFSDHRAFASGNRCERGAKHARARKVPRAAPPSEPGSASAPLPLPNLFAWKYDRVFRYSPLDPVKAPRGMVGIPRVLNLYEDYPFWFTLFTALGFSVKLSPRSSRSVYDAGIETIPSESACYPGKLVHGHVMRLLKEGVPFLFYPCVPHSAKEDPRARNHFNCPIVASYPEVVRNNIDGIRHGPVRYANPFLPLHHPERLKKRLMEELAWAGVTRAEVAAAVDKGRAEQARFRAEVRARGEETLREVRRRGLRGLILAGRPYHMDPEINHGIAELAVSLGMAVLTEDSVSHLGRIERPLRVVDQWVYHTRLYAAASLAAERDDLALVQINSFGCGLDAVTTDQVQEIMEKRGKIHTVIKVDEQSNLGAVRIRLRSLKAALDAREKNRALPRECPPPNPRPLFTREMRKSYTILAPQMSPIHFRIVEEAFRLSGYRLEILPDVDREAINQGLTSVNNDACFPSILVVGQLMAALRSGRYDLSRTALLMSQTGGGCRATNYIAFIRKALADAGLGHVPVISVNAMGLERNPGFRVSWRLLIRGLMAVIYGDLLMRMLYKVRPYETTPGAAQRLCNEWTARCREALARPGFGRYRRTIRDMVRDFDALPQGGRRKPRVGVVGEILVKFHPTANNGIVEMIESEAAEAVVPDLADFLLYASHGGQFRHRKLAGSLGGALLSRAAIAGMEILRRPQKRALARSRRFDPPHSIYKLARGVDGIVQLGNVTGEGWFLTAEMVELMEEGVTAIACIQPFACLPNHVTGKGMIRELRKRHPEATIAAIDYDPGASEVNQLNRLKLLLASAREAHAGTEERA